MRTVLFLVAGLLLMAGLLVLGKLFSSNYAVATRVATIGFVALWLILAGANMWVGVAKAGYSFADELPIFALIFGLPAAAALLVHWRLL